MEERIVSFRRSVEDHFRGLEVGRGQRYPADLRREGGELARELVLRGETYHQVGGRLGVTRETAQKWVAALTAAGEEREESSPPAPRAQGLMLREVEVVAKRPDLGRHPVEPSPGDRVLVTAAGHRVEGLEVSELIRVLEVLG